MDSITLENFRCFRERQEARLAPLTLLVGENSTGKTSFLALVRALWELGYTFRNPDFKQEPYDLGSFDEIVHDRGSKEGQADWFQAGFRTKSGPKSKPSVSVQFNFEKKGTVPIPVRRHITRGRTWIDETLQSSKDYILKVGTIRGSWDIKFPKGLEFPFTIEGDFIVPPSFFLLGGFLRSEQSEELDFVSQNGSPSIEPRDVKNIRAVSRHLGFAYPEGPFASAPVRSKPRRTYDPSRPTPDPEGDYVPMYLADMYSQDREAWTNLKQILQEFGKDAGLFDEISIRRLGRKGSEPFQVQIRQSGGQSQSPRRNLIDVGYGVSQVLPVVTELLRPNAPHTFLLQQPEVHLHPSAQAALGSLFCKTAGSNRQIIVETHSDYLLDRVRMDIRDGKGNLKPEDVSILYFERGDMDAHIHSLRIDEEGNILDAPDSYRSFFMEETAKSLGL
ncbi:MAG: AAA family ATPase [Chloroflexota bacterium]|nr:AAA family ATPase [Chloroflexota bacterium]